MTGTPVPAELPQRAARPAQRVEDGDVRAEKGDDLEGSVAAGRGPRERAAGRAVEPGGGHRERENGGAPAEGARSAAGRQRLREQCQRHDRRSGEKQEHPLRPG